MSISEKIEQAQARKSGQGFAGQRPKTDKPEEQSNAVVPAARVESAKALNLALQQSVQEFGQLAQGYEQAADQVADDIAGWMVGALNGERFAAKVLNATAQKLEERQTVDVVAAPAFDAPKATSTQLFEAHLGKALGGHTPKQIEG